MAGTVWRGRGAAVLRVLTVWAVTTVVMIALALVLPRFRLQSADGDSFTRVGITAALGAGAFGLLNALVWPWLVRALLLVPSLALGLLVFLLNGSLLLLALSLIPDRGAAGPGTAVVVATVMSAASSATSTLLAVRHSGAQRRRLQRLAGRHLRRAVPAQRSHPSPGTVILQLDGVGHDVLREAVRGPDPLMPTVARLCRESHRLVPWHTDWSSQTGAAQLGILHGSNEDVPAFRWYEKETGELVISNRPSSAAELQRRAVARTGSPGLLAGDGASRGNLFSGGAAQAALVLSVAARRGRRERSRAGYFAYFSDPGHAGRTLGSFAVEVAREIGQSLRSRLRGDRPRVKRGGLYPLIRAFATVVQRDVVVASVTGDVLNGRTVVYADLVAYDEVAHHSGPRSPDARQVLARLDRCVADILGATGYAPRPYHLVLLSDHGQSPGEPFADAFGERLEDVVQRGCGRPVPRQIRHPETGAEARGTARAALHRPEEPPVPEPAGAQGAGRRAPVVLGSGNLGLVSFPEIQGRASRETLEGSYPQLLRTLTGHPGIGFVLVHSRVHGPVVLGPGGSEHRLRTGEVLGPDPLAPFGPYAAAVVRRTAGFRNVPDLMVNSAVDPATGAVHAFEDQIGSHGGLGGEQSRAFLLSPLALSEADAEGPLTGAESVHRMLRRWLREAAEEPRERDTPWADGAASPAGPSPHA